MAIDETRAYLTSLFSPEYHSYIEKQLARDFAVTLAEKLRGSCNTRMHVDALNCGVCGKRTAIVCTHCAKNYIVGRHQ